MLGSLMGGPGAMISGAALGQTPIGGMLGMQGGGQQGGGGIPAGAPPAFQLGNRFRNVLNSAHQNMGRYTPSSSPMGPYGQMGGFYGAGSGGPYQRMSMMPPGGGQMGPQQPFIPQPGPQRQYGGYNPFTPFPQMAPASASNQPNPMVPAGTPYPPPR